MRATRRGGIWAQQQREFRDKVTGTQSTDLARLQRKYNQKDQRRKKAAKKEAKVQLGLKHAICAVISDDLKQAILQVDEFALRELCKDLEEFRLSIGNPVNRKWRHIRSAIDSFFKALRASEHRHEPS